MRILYNKFRIHDHTGQQTQQTRALLTQRNADKKAIEIRFRGSFISRQKRSSRQERDATRLSFCTLSPPAIPLGAPADSGATQPELAEAAKRDAQPTTFCPARS